MVEPNDKRRKIEESNGGTIKVKGSKIFNPFRVLGNVTDSTPFSIGNLGSTFYAVTSIGKSFQIYDLNTLHLLFVSQTQTPSKITCLNAHFHYVYAAYSNKIGIYKRGRLEHTLTCETQGNISHMIVFGEYLIATCTLGNIFVFRKIEGMKYPTELYTVIKVVKNVDINGEIVGLIHPPTYLNKIVVVTTSGLFIINVRSRKLLFKSDNFQNESLSCIESAPVLDVVALGTTKGNIFLYNLKKGKILGDVIKTSGSENGDKITSISFRSDGTPHLVASLNSGDLYFYDLNKKARVHILRSAHKESYGGVSKAQFLNGQPILLTNGGDNHLKEFVFDPNLSTSNSSIIAPPRHLRSRGGHSAPPIAINFPDEDKTHYLLSASRDRSFWSFSLRKDAQAQEMSQRLPKTKDGKRQAGQVSSIKEKFPEILSIASSNSREGEWENIVTCHKDEPFARTWNSTTKKVGRHNLPTVDHGICKSICISQCGNFALVGSSFGGIGSYNLQSGLLRKKYMLHKNTSVTGLAIDGMNRKMVSCGLDGIIGFYDFSKSKYVGKLQLNSPITQMIYHKSSDLIACALDDLSIVVVDVTTQKIVRVLYGHTNRVSGLDFSPDGRWIVSVSLDSTLRTWDLPTGGCIDGIILPTVATNVKFSPLGDLLATTHVSGNGISLWTNKSQFKPISTRHIEEEEEFANILLPNASGDGGATLLDGAFDEEEIELNTGSYLSVDQIDKNLITLSLKSRDKFNTLLYLDNIKQRNKPKEAVKKPEKAPFFLQLQGEQVGDRAIVAENGTKELEKDEEINESRLLKLSNDGIKLQTFESEFTKRLRESSDLNDYSEFINYLVNLPPSKLDLEIRSLNTIPPLNEITNFLRSLNFALSTKCNFEIIQSLFTMFLRNHGDIIHQNENEVELNEQINQYLQLNKSMNNNLDELTKYCSSIISLIGK
ncbi:unnamed protein product [Candida verbasci]|uniref:Small-subunit processome Utp21 domain-containing protein n=1 Tax=Candida verbasci TaxID=1227364 RepID=A0A9W4X902_9ASCO|nr:unnamed protein product [Candida verbasci]